MAVGSRVMRYTLALIVSFNATNQQVASHLKGLGEILRMVAKLDCRKDKVIDLATGWTCLNFDACEGLTEFTLKATRRGRRW